MASYSYCGNFPVLSDSVTPTTAPTVTNITITAPMVGAEQSHILPNGTKKILIKHRNKGKINFSFISGLSNYIEIQKGTNYSETNLNTENETLFYETNKVGTIEILTWT